MFNDGLSIVSFVENNFLDMVREIVYPQILQELDLNQETPTYLKEKSSPSERITTHEVAAKLHCINDTYLRRNLRRAS
ncbi:hypothetical protein U9M48_004898, partial [Paspalum notatum var. saurae]